MRLLFDKAERPVSALLHPTDFSAASLTAFHHALALSIRYGAGLTLLHAVGRRATDSWPDFPSVSQTLARWRSAGGLSELGSDVLPPPITKLEVEQRDPVKASLNYMKHHAIDVIVLATEGASGLERLVRVPRAERLSRKAEKPTLFVPAGVRPFVAAESGDVSLRKIVVPVGADIDPGPAMLFAVRLAALLVDPSVEITLLRVGGDAMELLDVPQLPFCRWNVVQRPGRVIDGIVETAQEIGADAICMSTAWHAPRRLRAEGAVTERVISSAGCPVVAVPV